MNIIKMPHKILLCNLFTTTTFLLALISLILFINNKNTENTENNNFIKIKIIIILIMTFMLFLINYIKIILFNHIYLAVIIIILSVILFMTSFTLIFDNHKLNNMLYSTGFTGILSSIFCVLMKC